MQQQCLQTLWGTYNVGESITADPTASTNKCRRYSKRKRWIYVTKDEDNNGTFDHLDAITPSLFRRSRWRWIDDSIDLDDDNDGIFDTAEGDDTIDTDNDSTPDYKDTILMETDVQMPKKQDLQMLQRWRNRWNSYNANGTVAGSGYTPPADAPKWNGRLS